MFRQTSDYDLVCLSNLRWDFIYRRPQHLLTRCAKERCVVYFEEPTFGASTPWLDIKQRATNLYIAVPRLPAGLKPEEIQSLQYELLDELLWQRLRQRYVLWYYSPLAIHFSRQLRPLARIYDCLDEPLSFAGAPTELALAERELLGCSDLVFTGAQSLSEVKRAQHQRVHAFPSSADVAHFRVARNITVDPEDQARLPKGPRLGYFGVIDERIDLELLGAVAAARPDWQLVMVGPVVKLDAARLPQRDNIHWLGQKSYAELPQYIAGWDAALVPFARNAATRFLCPGKTPEYLAAGKPVIATPIRDLVTQYGERGLLRIAGSATELVRAVEDALSEDRAAAQARADAFLAQRSWDRTWDDMRTLMDEVVRERGQARPRVRPRLSEELCLAALRAPAAAPPLQPRGL